MPDPIRVLHFADLHVGMENYGRLDPSTGTSSRVRDFLDRLDEVSAYALEHEADLAVFAGDAFKSRDPNQTQQREFARRVKRLAEAMPVLLLVGNHDMPGMVSKANSLDIFRALEVPDVLVGYKPEGRVVETRRGPLYLAWMPYPMRNRLLAQDEYKGTSLGELDEALGEIVVERLKELAEEADEHDMPRLLACHFSVAEAKFGSERSVMLGRDVALHISELADPRWDYVAMGHIHSHQSLNAGSYPPVVYSGSLERIDFGEEGQPKGFCWVELARGETNWSFIPVAARPFRTLQVDVRDAKDPTAEILEVLEDEDLEGAVVRLQVLLYAEQEAALRERDIERSLEQVSSLSVQREIETEKRMRLGDVSPEALTPLELVERYFKSKDVEGDRLTRLLEKAQSILQP
jgi:exonuclease SbcD